jgi:hypothetical protein
MDARDIVSRCRAGGKKKPVRVATVWGKPRNKLIYL